VIQAFYICYLVLVVPSEDRKAHLQEIANEIITMLCLYLMAGMDQSATGEFKYKLGYVFISVFLSYLGLNVFLMIFESFHTAIY
jgi:hypothetical protein